MSKLIENPKRVLGIMAVLLNNVSLNGVDDDTVSWIIQNPSDAGLEFGNFLKRIRLNAQKITVDRSTFLKYPDFTKEVVHAGMGNFGPSEYSLECTETHLHPDQLNTARKVWGDKLYRYIVETNRLVRCLSLHDGLAIREKGRNFFNTFFGDQIVYCWRSAVVDNFGHISIPRIYKNGDVVEIDWVYLSHFLDHRCPVVCFKEDVK